jgi:uncharacterized membrane protein (DUF485 family)
MTFWRSKNDESRVSGPDLQSGPNSIASIDLEKDSPDVIERKLDLMARRHSLYRKNKRFSDKRADFQMIFYPSFVIALIAAAFSLYVLLTASSHEASEIAVAQFVISTVVSSALASGIALMASQPDP